MMLLLYLVFLSLANLAFSTCVSYGIDFVNRGFYFIGSTKSTDFTFLSQFEGCTSGEEITPILVDPNGDEYFCSQITTTPDDTSILSTCPILQTDMFSANWYVVIEGLTFAYVRTFTLTVGIPATIKATPTSNNPLHVLHRLIKLIPVVTVDVTSTPDAVKARHARDVFYPKACGMTFNVALDAGVVKRGPGEATTLEYLTTIKTITPSPVTKCSGVTKVLSTSTAPTKTFTSLSVTKVTFYATKTVSFCHTIKITTTPRALQTSCIGSGGSI
ncbi:hypothetical protein IFR04_009368 [Cadophora malorum]|uniref:Uncharacterized protein n=1 Tax=Cadophora malorum TaxID=108018 RepID=A0A8H7TE53_9HELO|nr:hypothetical protein IFR04_009368 [Cadophora malorum]